jgi:hypothetical protein
VLAKQQAHVGVKLAVWRAAGVDTPPTFPYTWFFTMQSVSAMNDIVSYFWSWRWQGYKSNLALGGKRTA